MKPRYITRGIQTTIPPWLQTLLWYMHDSMEVPERDYLQIFRYPVMATVSASSMLRNSQSTSTLSRSRANTY